MKKIIGYVNTADLNHMREEDVRALTVINIAFGLIRGRRWRGLWRAERELDREEWVYPVL